MSKKRKRKPKAKPPPVVADLFDVPETPPTAPLEPAPCETVARVARSTKPARTAPAAPRDPVREPSSVAVREVCSFPAEHIASLPGAFTLRCELDGAPLVFTSSRTAYAEAREARVPVFVLRELVALAHAAQNDRMPAHALEDVIARKRESPELVVAPAYAFGGMPIKNADALSCTVGEALARMGVELVEVDDAMPAIEKSQTELEDP
jgi:hypothetical protein